VSDSPFTGPADDFIRCKSHRVPFCSLISWGAATQHPLQMLLTFLSTIESCVLSALIVSSPCILGPAVAVPSMRPPTAPPAGFPAVPTVVEPMGTPPALEVEPAELAVPAELVPGALDVVLGALPTPLGSLPELLRPPTSAGPYIPVAAGAPPLADPAPGALVADPDAPPVDPPPAEPPPADPPPPPPPPLCAKVDIGERRTAARSNLHGNEMDIGKLLFSPTPWKTPRSKAGTNLRGAGRAVSRPAGSFDRHSGATGN
jgi:hypothetical protein